MNTPLNFCNNCTHYKRGTLDQSQCTHPEALHDVDLVHGTLRYHTAAEMRRNLQLCGRDARYFAAKPQPTRWQKLIKQLGITHD